MSYNLFKNAIIGNFKGIYFEEEPDTKIRDPDTGAHFDFNDMFSRLKRVETYQKSNVSLVSINKIFYEFLLLKIS